MGRSALAWCREEQRVYDTRWRRLWESSGLALGAASWNTDKKCPIPGENATSLVAIETAVAVAGYRCVADNTSILSRGETDRLRNALDLAGVSSSDLVVPGATGLPVHSKWKIVSVATRVSPEHIVPFSWGGDSSIENLAPCCGGCNYARNSWSLDALVPPALNARP